MSNTGNHPIVLTRAQVREVDRRAIEEFGIPGVVLMENAGRNAAALIAEWSKPGDQIAIVCGAGNNGGDGFVIARHLSNQGIGVEVFLATPEPHRGDAAINRRIVERMGLPLHDAFDAESMQATRDRLARSSLIVDALLGTGFTGQPRFPIDAAIDAVNAAGPRIVAIDVPSGMDCDTGHASGVCVKAWRTITFVAMKQGFLAPGAAAATGDVYVADIGAPVKLIQEIAAFVA